MKPEAARALELSDRKSLLALRGVGRESEAESVRFHGRRVTKSGPVFDINIRRLRERTKPEFIEGLGQLGFLGGELWRKTLGKGIW
jgi:hypothetical protein